MQKTRKSIAKRYKITGSGKVMRRSPGQRHLMRKKSNKQKRANGQDKQVQETFAKTIKYAVSPGS